MGRTLFIGDVHGCAAEFQALLVAMAYNQLTDRLFLTGDAFTRGPDPLGVWRLIEAVHPQMVMGNHDDHLMIRLKEVVEGGSPRIKFLNQQETVKSVTPVAVPLLDWLKRLPLWIEEDRFLLVHAGINPQKGRNGTKREEFLTIRTWPPVGGIVGPRWHDSLSNTDRLIVFGHDAPGGLVVKRRTDGSPCIIGLDSGCVYGNQLSGYILEEDRIVQVASTQAKTVGS